MKQYHIYISFAFLLIFLSACEEDELHPLSFEDYILFSAPKIAVDASTRSTFVEDVLPENSSFGVMGYCVPYQRNSTTDEDWASGIASWSSKRANAYPDVFYRQEVTYDGTSCTYSYTGTNSDNGLRKWYNSDDNPDAEQSDNYQYTFFAYYPYDKFDVTPADAATKGAPVLTFTMPITENNGILNDDEIPDAMLAVEYNHRRTGGSVGFNFNHIMVGLGFAVNNYNYGADDVVTITSITLSGNFIKSMTIDFNKDTNGQGFYSCSGTYSGTYEIFNGSQEIGPNTSIEPHKHLLLLSDAAGGTYFGTDVKVKVAYQFKGVNKTFSTGRPSDFMPRAGTKYTAQLNFVGETFVINFVAAEDEFWEDGGDSDITIQ
ncbi:fimbrillin family protein [uncultured Mediterranea sp.]|uniref:fimbrillin family protein n=1 Tax=uncultured Mediterranea sp. TaxID=1926662 RepID=UPI002804FFEA|nr:fimbrillin family protein [uncultured Mediterranea sp.]